MRKLLRLLTHNYDLKIAAILLAVVTWYYLATAGLEERRFPKVRVRVVNRPPTLALLKQSTDQVSVTLRGPRGRLDVLEGRRLVAEIDLEDFEVEPAATAEPRIRLGGANIRIAADGQLSTPLPGDVRFTGAEPATVTLALDRMTDKELPVEVKVQGNLEEGLQLRASAVPPRVRVRGPFRLLQTLTSIVTEPVPVEGLRESREVSARLQDRVNWSTFTAVPIFPAQRDVVVKLDVMQKPAEKTVERVPVRLAAVPRNLAVIQQEVREVTVQLRGSHDLLRDLDAQSLVVEISLEDQQPPAREPQAVNQFLLPRNIRQVAERGRTLELPSAVELTDVQPKTVPLILDRLRTRTLPVQPVLEGRPAEDYEVSKVTVVPSTVSVQGPHSVLQDLKAIETVPVLVGGVTERLRRTVRLVDRVDAGKYRSVRIEPSQEEVDVVVAVSERTGQKTLESLPIQVVLTPAHVSRIRVELEPRTTGPVTFVGPRSSIEAFEPEGVVAFVRLQLTSDTALRTTIRNVEFHIRDHRVRLAPDTKPFAVKIEFPPLEGRPVAPKPKKP